MLPSETMIWQPEFTDKTLSRKPGAVHKQQNAFFWQQASYSVCLCLPTWDLFNDTSAGKRPSQHCPSG
ncbi:hypothetical protein ARC77_05820 [Escherichia coli]|nr:hypothetical protein ARC77_05820 [Escherichia coli]EGL0986987.1 hypothetical protein [Escherichia coli]QJZ98736.1 hypothetical protein E3167_09740 [Escherichia coli O157:H7]